MQPTLARIYSCLCSLRPRYLPLHEEAIAYCFGTIGTYGTLYNGGSRNDYARREAPCPSAGSTLYGLTQTQWIYISVAIVIVLIMCCVGSALCHKIHRQRKHGLQHEKGEARLKHIQRHKSLHRNEKLLFGGHGGPKHGGGVKLTQNSAFLREPVGQVYPTAADVSGGRHPPDRKRCEAQVSTT
mmetsp:Transcript_32153/g.96896  ORF Transcript_32153/g.96896 Transcript_32153/m.96896 type:complete len:184 (-) Transcript_32153:147-698(-)